LIVTDGLISDFRATIDEIVRGGNNPMSIIIVGVGDKWFKEMEILDGDGVTPIYSEKYKKFRSVDITQFVPF